MLFETQYQDVALFFEASWLLSALWWLIYETTNKLLPLRLEMSSFALSSPKKINKCINKIVCLPGPDISIDQEDHIEDTPHLLPHGHSHRVGHGHRYGSKTLFF